MEAAGKNLDGSQMNEFGTCENTSDRQTLTTFRCLILSNRLEASTWYFLSICFPEFQT